MHFLQSILIFSFLGTAWCRPPVETYHPLVRHGRFPDNLITAGSRNQPRAPHGRRQEPSAAGSCNVGSHFDIKAPKANIFDSLSDDETAAVTSFLHDQKRLNLTAAATATPWDNRILLVELLAPNKTDALAYLDSGGQAPVRYARALLVYGATLEPYLREYQVGPLPVKKGVTKVFPLDYPYNGRKGGYQRIYNFDLLEIALWAYSIGESVADITKDLLGGIAAGGANDTLGIAGSNPLIHEGDRVYQWNQFYVIHSGDCIDEDLLLSGLEFKSDITGRDPSKWSVVAWHFNGIYYPSTAAFRNAVKSPGFVKPGPPVDGKWACTDYNGQKLPHDNLNPPVPVQPDGTRFSVDKAAKYIEWMDFSFYFTSTRELGVQLFNIKYKGERIIYEVGLQEALAHYASASDPFQATTAYLDSQFGFGDTTFQLVSGYDCPAYATYLNTSFNIGETSHIHPDSVCIYEFDTGYPIQRHTTDSYVSVTKNIALILRSVATIGNYDYMFDYEFYLDGSMHVTVRASGYIQSSYWATTTPPTDGFHIHDRLAGSIHDHVLNYKLDMDVAGTKNSLIQGSLVPTTQVYPWSNGKAYNTMSYNRKFISSENDAKLNWDANNAIWYTVVNKDKVNPYGEYRGYKIMPATNNKNYLTIQNSTDLGKSVNWATNHLYAVQRHDTEQHSTYPYNAFDPNNPVTDFGKWFNGESLDQQDLVIYFNLGMHHIPDTSDVPNTVFTTAHSSMIITPQNYLLGDPSRGTIHQTRINYVNGSVTNALTFGSKPPTCTVDLSITAPNIDSFVGEIYVSKFPYHPDAIMIGDPGDAIAPGFA